jgi:hypothetical protein
MCAAAKAPSRPSRSCSLPIGARSSKRNGHSLQFPAAVTRRLAVSSALLRSDASRGPGSRQPRWFDWPTAVVMVAHSYVSTSPGVSPGVERWGGVVLPGSPSALAVFDLDRSPVVCHPRNEDDGTRLKEVSSWGSVPGQGCPRERAARAKQELARITWQRAIGEGPRWRRFDRATRCHRRRHRRVRRALPARYPSRTIRTQGGA